MKKTFLFLSLMALVACSSEKSNKSEQNQEQSTTVATFDEKELIADTSNADQPYAEFVNFGNGTLSISGGHMLELEFKPEILKASNTSYNNNASELILLNESGKKLARLHPFGVNSSFEKAFNTGDELYKGKFVFIESLDSDAEALEIANDATSFTLVLPLQDKPIMEDEPVNELANWDPVGTYSLTDAEGTPFTLVVMKGGSAELINQNLAKRSTEYKPSKGSWTKNSSKGFLKMSFYEGPFITIGSHYAVISPVLTPDYFYYDESAYNNDTDCLKANKVN